MKIPFFLFIAFVSFCPGQDPGNTIRKHDFNFGHQLGYMYSRMDDAYFGSRGEWSFETGFMGYYTEKMPRVANPDWQERLMLALPLYFTACASDAVTLQFDLTDLFVEFPYRDIHSTGGKSPRFRAKMKLFSEGRLLPAAAFTIGVKFSSAKPYNIWEKNHNYEESNGLSGAGTGVADYLLLFLFSKRLSPALLLHWRLGIAPLGSPVEYERGSGQADEIPYGLSAEYALPGKTTVKAEIAGMYNGLESTELAHYSVARLNLIRRFSALSLTLDLERGLTEESDDWVAGFYTKFDFNRKSRK